MKKIQIYGRPYFFCEKCRRKFMFEKTYSGHKCAPSTERFQHPDPCPEVTNGEQR
jgi:hypothetical protein